jgi:hypothetical protein
MDGQIVETQTSHRNDLNRKLPSHNVVSPRDSHSDALGHASENKHKASDIGNFNPKPPEGEILLNNHFLMLHCCTNGPFI